GATKEEVSIADAMTKGTASHEMFARMQSEMLVALQSLETDTVAKAKKALSAVGSKEQPIEQSVASEHLVALQNVVQAELYGSTVGHSGGEEDPRAKVYIKGLYDRTKSSMGEGFRARSKGAVLGVQSEVTEDLTLGVGYATSQTTAKEDLRRTEVDTNTGFVSAHYQPNAWWVSGLATFSRGEYEEEKQILSSIGKASYNVDSWGAQVITGYDIKLENAIITPEVGMRYLSVKQEGYTDTLGTTVSGTQSDYLTALVGVKGTWDMGAIRPTAGVTVGYDIVSDDVSALNTLANGASYTVNGEALDRLSTTVTTGIEADLGDRTTLKLEYSGTYRKEYVDHSGMLRLEVKF
ncbi:MAG: autotransporter outer membrane beta-barrel domain-containing protein, partial [Alphaproteobacteria bacterium]|nr:autotransporter outer membrane beta-barrel domain-containing protein [Alphaproteobacteria bacterium]